MEYMSAREAADKWGISQRRVAVLCSDQRVQTVYRRYTGLDKFRRIFTRRRVDGCAVDVQSFFGNDSRAAVNGVAHTIKYS